MFDWVLKYASDREFSQKSISERVNNKAVITSCKRKDVNPNAAEA